MILDEGHVKSREESPEGIYEEVDDSTRGKREEARGVKKIFTVLQLYAEQIINYISLCFLFTFSINILTQAS